VGFAAMPADADGRIIPERIKEVVQPNTRLACVSHISNVSGTVQPLADIGGELKRWDIPFMVDASQSAGCHALDVTAMNIDVVAAPGHKSLLGLPGSGVLYLNERLKPAPFRVGGTGVKSELYHLPPELPVYYESGTPNVLGIIALEASLGFIFEQTVEAIEKRHRELTARVLAALQERPGVSVVGPTDPAIRAPVVSFNIEGYAPKELSQLLAEKYHIAHRGGLHCAPMAHEFFGTTECGGSVRVSPAYLTPDEEVDYFCDVLDELTA
jgi:selenocysteine lyase/cysteine desulfurase